MIGTPHESFRHNPETSPYEHAELVRLIWEDQHAVSYLDQVAPTRSAPVPEPRGPDRLKLQRWS